MTWLCFVLCFAALLMQGLALRCYECFSSNIKSCNRTKTVVKCSEKHKDDMCITMSYLLVEDKHNSERVYQTGCAPSYEKCDFHCKLMLLSGESQCQSSCCSNDLCNHPSNEKLVPASLTSECTKNRTRYDILIVLLLVVYKYIV
ncbi:uncharacterized protein LOC130625727 [Hydractinia symbiolongicarpus]|uniref:uncharacterized protein LOC130625727 n=1 Tax=Hydractinia symbiolongicarpus TaxID=13093 RepID=UPI00254F36F4|nr:uncharacterized protein LOC130625727 [Hydractinia symbiolongicarpus]